MFSFQDVYFIEQFGEGDIIPNVNAKTPCIGHKDQETIFGHVVLSLDDAVRMLNPERGCMDTWVVRPTPNVDLPFVYKDDIKNFAKFSEIPWKKCSPMSLGELHDYVFWTRTAGRPYSVQNNNCQHFACELFDVVVSAQDGHRERPEPTHCEHCRNTH